MSPWAGRTLLLLEAAEGKQRFREQCEPQERDQTEHVKIGNSLQQDSHATLWDVILTQPLRKISVMTERARRRVSEASRLTSLELPWSKQWGC